MTSIPTELRKNQQYIIKIEDPGYAGSTWRKVTALTDKIVTSEAQIDLEIPLLLFIKSDSFHLQKGDVVLFDGELLEIKNKNNPGEFDAQKFWNNKGFYMMTFLDENHFTILDRKGQHWFWSLLDDLRSHLNQTLESHMKGQELAIAKALVLGDKSLLAVETRNSFVNTGAMHVLAVSGLHIGLILQILLFLLQLFDRWLSKRNAYFIAVVFLWIYACVTGLSPSVVRAVFMFSVLFYTQVSSKRYEPINVLFFTAFVLFFINPLVLFDIGFQLSYLAMLGIFLCYRPIASLYSPSNKIVQKVWQGTAIGFAAQIMTTPLSLYYFHQFPNYFALTNIGLMATSGLILGLGLLHFTISWWKTLAWLNGWLLSMIVSVSFIFIVWVEALPGALALGFELSFGMVCLMTILGGLLFLSFPSRIAYQMGSILALGLVFWVVLTRFENMHKSEICLFNAKQLVFTVKKNQEIFCFYRSNKDEFKKVTYMVENYQKVAPGKIHYFSLEDKNWNLSTSELNVQTKKNESEYCITVNGKDYLIETRNKLITNKNATVFNMPWVDSKVGYSLKSGAYIKRI